MVTETIRVCLAKPLHLSGEELALSRLWPQNTTLRIQFLGGDTHIQAKVRQYASLWLPYINLHFAFVDDPQAEIRISFELDGTSWSAIGTDALSAEDFPEATMNFGWLTPNTSDLEFAQVVLHEFGHALGCVHEHQSPSAKIQWNQPFIYAYCEREYGWSKAQVDRNFFDWENAPQFSRFDPHSIMIYEIPKAFTLDGFEVGWNHELSVTDKQFIASVYPRISE